MSTTNKNESRPDATLLGVVGHQGTAVGGGSPQVSISVTKVNAQKTTEKEKIGDKGIDNGLEKTQKKKVNIKELSENELMYMLRNYVERMATFAGNNKNVHKKLKECTANARVVMQQYVIVSHKEKTLQTAEIRANSLESINTELMDEVKGL